MGVPSSSIRFGVSLSSPTSLVIDDRIEYFAEVVMQHHKIEEFVNPTKANQVGYNYPMSNEIECMLTISVQSNIMAVGRICCEDVEGKLNEQSIMLESSRFMGMGKRVKLNLGNLSGFSLFPGQVSMNASDPSLETLTY